MIQHDPFRPHREPASRIYDAFQAEAQKRKGRPLDEWTKAELDVVWATSRDYAQQQGLPVPSLEQIERAERRARGHIDYGAKWAYGIAELFQPAKA